MRRRIPARVTPNIIVATAPFLIVGGPVNGLLSSFQVSV